MYSAIGKATTTSMTVTDTAISSVRTVIVR